MPASLRLLPIISLALALAACGGRDTGGFRRDVPIYSNAVFDIATLEGTYVQTAAFSDARKPECREGGAAFRPDAGAISVIGRLCLDGKAVSVNSDMIVTGPGRLTPQKGANAPLDRQWWLLWADTDRRTLVFGTPDGRFGFILNRAPDLPEDRLTAAKQVLNFNGYDLARLNVW